MEKSSDIRKEIIKELEEVGITLRSDEDDILVKFEELCASYYSSPGDVVEGWIAFTTNKNISHEPTFESLCQFEREGLSKKLTKTPVRNAVKIARTPRSTGMPFKHESVGSKVLSNYDTPIKKRQLTPETSPAGVSIGSNKYEKRTSKGSVSCCWGETSTCIWISSDIHTVSAQYYDSSCALTGRYQFMFDKLKVRMDILNDIINQEASLFKHKHEIDEWSDFSLPSPNDLTVVGRICSEGNGKLNPSSVLLEGSTEICSGNIIPLEIKNLSQYAFFPGQIIAGKGRNLLGKCLIMSSLFEPKMLPFPEKIPKNETDILQIVVAAGPFTTSDNLLYEPLADLLRYVTENRPHICILIGPLIDSKHKFLEKNLIEDDLDVIYDRLLQSIEATRKESSTHIVIVSSYSDILQDYVYPTPPMISKQYTKLHFVSDPSVIDIDGIVIGVTSTDVLFHFIKEEIASYGGKDRLGRFAQHILTQKSFYPLYPPNEDINIDYEHYETYAKLPVMPHILLLPSSLGCFIKNISGCCCINPERLTKGESGGHFCRIQIDMNSCRANYSGSICDHIKSEIVKI